MTNNRARSSQLMDTARPATMQESPAVKALGQLEEMTWLEATQQGLTEAIQPLVTKAEQTGEMDFLHGRWLGHALHPDLSDLPLGLWTASVFLDLLVIDVWDAVMIGTGS